MDRLLCSPLLRARATAMVLCEAHAGLPEPEIHDDLAEQDFGVWEGRRHADIPELRTADMAALAHLRPPGGESFADVVARLRDFLSRESRTGSSAIVAHAGVIRAALAVALDLAPHRALAFTVTPLSITAITDHGPGGFAVAYVNRIA